MPRTRLRVSLLALAALYLAVLLAAAAHGEPEECRFAIARASGASIGGSVYVTELSGTHPYRAIHSNEGVDGSDPRSSAGVWGSVRRTSPPGS